MVRESEVWKEIHRVPSTSNTIPSSFGKSLSGEDGLRGANFRIFGMVAVENLGKLR
jgi:hypothetical protein